MIETDADSVQTVHSVGKYHPYWMQKLDGNRLSQYIENDVYRRQDLPPLYMLDGCLIALKYECLMVSGESDDPFAHLGKDRRSIVQKSHETVDIDTLRDFFVAEAALKENRCAIAPVDWSGPTPHQT